MKDQKLENEVITCQPELNKYSSCWDKGWNRNYMYSFFKEQKQYWSKHIHCHGTFHCLDSGCGAKQTSGIPVVYS